MILFWGSKVKGQGHRASKLILHTRTLHTRTVIHRHSLGGVTSHRRGFEIRIECLLVRPTFAINTCSRVLKCSKTVTRVFYSNIDSQQLCSNLQVQHCHQVQSSDHRHSFLQLSMSDYRSGTSRTTLNHLLSVPPGTCSSV